RSHPRRGSMAFSPRKRSRRPFGHVKSWPNSNESEVRIQGFAGWKAGMTHVLSRDLNPKSTSAG
ncbi:MAG TPA: 50S ribosomal protein L3, partial [Candidatus Poseidoniales archaeon]